MNKEIYLKQISDTLGTLSFQLKNRSSLNLYDINILAEDLFKDLLNLIFGYELENLNIVDKHATAIDLGDKKSSVSVQVTSENRSEKVRETMNKFNAEKLYEKYKTLIILIVGKKKNYRKDFENQSLFFKMKIWDIEDLLRHIRGLETPGLEKIADFLQKEFEVKTKQGSPAVRLLKPNEVETIMWLIEYLSKYEKIYSTDEMEEEPDPENKIYKRFSNHSKFLVSQYQELAPPLW